MKSTSKKKWLIIIVALILFLGSIFAIAQNSPKKVSGKWELIGVCENSYMRYGYFGEYEYFNINLSDDGAINVFCSPKNYHTLGVYQYRETKNGKHIYMAELFPYVEGEETESISVEIVFLDSDEILLLFSADDGLILQRTEMLTTAESTTREKEDTKDIENMYQYKENCQRYINSKDLVRYEDSYLGDDFCYMGSVFEVDEDDRVYTLCIDENNDGLYGDNIIYVKDFRSGDKTKILEGDIITIYGRFVGVSTNNHPCFQFYYADIQGVY